MNIQNPELLIFLVLAAYPIFLAIKNKGYGRKITVLRTVTIILLVLAATSPTITQNKTLEQKENLNVLIDNTTSMKALDKPSIPVEHTEKIFIEGNNSNIFSKAGSKLEESDKNILLTDGRTRKSPESLIKKAESLNTSVSILKLEERAEASAVIEGPSSTVPKAENNYTVRITSTKDEKIPVKIQLDEETIFEGKIKEDYSFVERFNSKGLHKIKAKINSTDVFKQNNRFYKTIKVNKKPEILSIGERGVLEQKLSQFYRIKNVDKIPENLDDYNSVILKKPVETTRLESYLAEGNGLMYTGSLKNNIPDYLPLKQVAESDDDAGAKIVLVIDASFGTGKCVDNGGNSDGFCTDVTSQGGSAKESIQIAYSLVESLSKNNNLGVTAYNRNSYLVSKPKPLSNSKTKLKNQISRIKPEGPSFHDRGLKGGSQLVNKNDTVVMITDGKIGNYEKKRNVPSKLETISSNMEAKLITVGVGEDANKPLLKDISENTEGYYLRNKESGRLNFEFGAGGGENNYKSIGIIRSDHFITENLRLNGSTTNFDNVKSKELGNVLVKGSNAKPVLSTWRFGLGRVAAFSADNKNLQRISNTDSELITRSISWTVGNPKRKQENWLTVSDARKPSNPEAEASYDLQGFTKQTNNLYTKKLEKPALGIQEWKESIFAYNYNKEKQKIGQNMEKLSKIPKETGGSIINQGNIKNISENLQTSKKQVKKQRSLSPFIISIALLTLLIEIGYRKRKSRL